LPAAETTPACRLPTIWELPDGLSEEAVAPGASSETRHPAPWMELSYLSAYATIRAGDASPETAGLATRRLETRGVGQGIARLRALAQDALR
jgi:hypothetical protein